MSCKDLVNHDAADKIAAHAISILSHPHNARGTIGDVVREEVGARQIEATADAVAKFVQWLKVQIKKMTFDDDPHVPLVLECGRVGISRKDVENIYLTRNLQ